MKKDINKITITVMIIHNIILSLFYVGIIGICSLYFKNDLYLDIAITIATVLMIIYAFASLYFETYFGFYECKNCQEKFVPTFKEVFLSSHIGHTRHLRCPKCNEKTWARKIKE